MRWRGGGKVEEGVGISKTYKREVEEEAEDV